jgi:hypothetical protein
VITATPLKIPHILWRQFPDTPDLFNRTFEKHHGQGSRDNERQESEYLGYGMIQRHDFWVTISDYLPLSGYPSICLSGK